MELTVKSEMAIFQMNQWGGLNLFLNRSSEKTYLFFNLIDFNFFPTSSKSVEYLEMFTAILIAYKTIIFASTAPSDDDLPKLPLQVIQIQVHIFYLLVFETQNNSREEN